MINQPGFIIWYPDFNELVTQNESFGIKTYIKNLFFNKKIKKGKLVEIGVLEEHRRSGLAVALLAQVHFGFERYGIKIGETSWILDENADSNSICRICEGIYKRYVVYEKDI